MRAYRELAHTCAMCGRHVEHAFRMSQHILKCHAQVHELLPAWNHAQLQFRGYALSTKCQYCNAQVKMLSQHRCPVLCQLACRPAPKMALFPRTWRSLPDLLATRPRRAGGGNGKAGAESVSTSGPICPHNGYMQTRWDVCQPHPRQSSASGCRTASLLQA